MDCSDFKDLMSLYLDGEIALEDKTEFEKHLESCPQCAGELECFRLISEKVRSMEEKELPEGFHSELMNKVENLKRKKYFFNIKTGYRFGALAAGIVVIMIVVFTGENGLKNDARIRGMIDGALKVQENLGSYPMESALSDDMEMGAAMKKSASLDLRESITEKNMPYAGAGMDEAASEEKESDIVEKVEFLTEKENVAAETDRIIALADEIVFLDMNSNSLGEDGAHIIISVLESRKDYVLELINDKDKKEVSFAEDLTENSETKGNEALVNIDINITAY